MAETFLGVNDDVLAESGPSDPFEIVVVDFVGVDGVP